MKMADHLRELSIDSGNSDMYSDAFENPQKTCIMRFNVGKPMTVIKNDIFFPGNKDKIVGSSLLTYGYGQGDMISDSGLSQLQVGAIHFENAQDLQCDKTLEIQNPEVFDGNPVIKSHGELNGEEVEIQLAPCEGRYILHQSDPFQEKEDSHINEVIQLIQQDENQQPEFVALESDKKRNPPYLIRDSVKITTKNNEPVKFCLKGGKVNQMLVISMRFTEEKHKNSPVNACPLHQGKESKETCNFFVSPEEEVNCTYEDILQHPTAHLTLNGNSLNCYNNDFIFYVTFRCLNSCHKEYGKKMEIVFKLMDPMKKEVLKESRFEIRACKNVKRDYKEAFQEDDVVGEKRICPESLIHQDEVQQDPSAYPEVQGIEKSKEVKVHMIQPTKTPESPARKPVVKCIPASEVKIPKFYLIKLPSIEKEGLILPIVKHLGGIVMDLEAVVPVESAVEELDP